MNQNDNVFNNPQFLAGLAMIRGVPAHEAYVNAAQQVQQMQKAQMEQQAFQRQQYAMQALPQIAQKLYNSPPQEAFQELVNIGIEPKEALVLLDAIQKQSMPDTFKGPGDVQYMKSFNRELGEWEAKPLRGQMSENTPAPTSSEIRTNNNEITKLRQNARGAARELRLLEDSAKAFEDFDTSTGENIGAGTLVSKLLPNKVDNLIYDKKAQTAKQEIAKLNSQLFQNRVSALGGSATDAAKQEILKGLPTTELTKEARNDLINTKKRENYEQILRSKFFDEWYKTNNKNLTGAEDAFNAFLSGRDLIDQNGNLNKSLLNEIPQTIKFGENIDWNNRNNQIDLESLANSVSIEDIKAALQGK